MTTINPIDWFNFHGAFASIFEGVKDAHMVTPYEAAIAPEINKVTFQEDNHLVVTLRENPYDIAVNSITSKFMLLTAVKFKGDHFAAMSYVAYFHMKIDIPYIRVGTDYFKLIHKQDRWGSTHTMLKGWRKEEIKDDHTKQLLQLIFKYDDFTIIPDNRNHVTVSHNCYNLYAKFPHTPGINKPIPVSMALMHHIFGDQVELGFKFLKVLYERPTQILPILTLVSTERETGKTTFLNWISMLFGDNSVLISPQDLSSNHNSGYATKNIIMIDETVIERSTSIEKLKSMATAKKMTVNPKFVQQYSVPFYGKFILCTNREKDFMRIDEAEIRFWIRKIKPISGPKNVQIEEDLFREIPSLLAYLTSLPPVDYSKSRMVFTQEEIGTSELSDVKEESKSQLRKEIEILIEDFFNNSNADSFLATAKDIKEKWFHSNHNYSIAYIRKVLKDEMAMKFEPLQKYNAFNAPGILELTGQPFEFKRTSESILPKNSELVDYQEQSDDIDLPF